MKNEKLDSLINDLNRAEKVREEISGMSVKLSDPIEELIDYGLKHSIISNSADVVYISKNTSDYITGRVTKMFDEHIEKEKEELKNNSFSQSSDYYKYAGIYESLDELNRKFGTDFNSRCIPEGAIIKRSCR